MTTGLDYNGFKAQVALLAVVDPADPNFLAALPQAITYAENRMYRDLDFLSTVTTNTANSFTANVRTLTFPLPLFVTIQNLNVITPYGTTNPDTGLNARRNPLLPVTKEVLDFTYPSAIGAGVPAWFAMLNQNTILVGPWPDQGYAVELVGTIRPDSLSASNTTTFISTYLPDMMLMAAMVYISGYQRNFGRQSDDPQMSVSYETQYKTLLASAMTEEFRKKFQAAAWTSMIPATAASPTRG